MRCIQWAVRFVGMADSIGRVSAVDVGVAAGVLVLVTIDELAAVADAGGGLGVVMAVSLVLRRVAPRSVLLLTVALLLLYSVYGVPSLLTSVPVLVAVYTAMLAGWRWFTIGLVSPVLLAVVVGGIVDGGGSVRDRIAAALLPVGWFVAAAVSGEVIRQYRAYLAQARELAEQAVRSREEVAARRAGQERLRIARELHDSLTHAISVIKLQAGVAVHLAKKRGEEVPEALSAIQLASQDANRELRATLRVLRDEEPVAGIDRLGDLVERSRAAGLEVAVECDGELAGLPAVTGHAVYRVVQEALTNVVKHASGARARVRLAVRADRIEVSVVNDGRPVGDVVEGMGLTGMRERVEALGGRLRVGAGDEGGFGVRAELPVEEVAA